MEAHQLPRIAISSIFALLVSLVAACSGDNSPVVTPPPPLPPPPPPQAIFIHEGLDGLTVHRIKQNNNSLFAATDTGLFSKPIGQDSWHTLGLDDSNIHDIVFINDEHWLAAVSDVGPLPNVNPQLLETVNGGSNWLQVDNDLGGVASVGMQALFYDSINMRLFATAWNALAVSNDVGRTWRLLDGNLDVLTALGALNWNEAMDQVWVGGQNNIEEMLLRRFDLQTGESGLFESLLPPPAAIKGITFDRNNPDRILASGEPGILQSLDNGDNWSILLSNEDARFYFETELDSEDSQIIYTAGWTKNFDDPQPLIIEVSRDGGANWVQYAHDDPNLFGGVWSLHAVSENNETVIYAGLFRGGIVKVILPAN
jgi:photosystem II stability/assembly factor-like uncharacterized protein